MSFYNHSFFTPYGDDMSYHSPYGRRHQQQLQIQRQREEALRRAEMERRYKEQQEAERLRWLRQLQEEEEQQNLIKKRQHLQQRKQEEQRRRKAAEAQRRREYEAEMDRRFREEQESQNHAMSPNIVRGSDGQQYSLVPLNNRPNRLDNVVRGSDGRLYKLVPYNNVQIGGGKKPRSEKKKTLRQSSTQNQMHQPMMDQTNKIQKRQHVSDEEAPENMDLDEEVMAPPRRRRTGKSNGKKKKKRVTIVVEDASDSEYENDEINSYWRHRKPSKGQWIEPVEG